MTSSRGRLLSSLVLLAVLAGCGAQGGVAEPSPSASSGASDPLALVGQWFLDADGEAAGSAIALGENLTLFVSCGVLDGQWKADGEQSLFVAFSAGGDDSCFSGSPRPLPWLDRAVAFRVDGDTRLLLDAEGRTVARLRPGAKPTVGPNRSKDYYEAPPSITPAMREAAGPAAPLPAGVNAATARSLIGKWRPVGLEPSSRAALTFEPGAVWSGSDGCNGAGGRYVLGHAGRLLATTGASTLIGCAGAPVGAWMAQAARAGLRDGHLLLLDHRGQTLGELTRSA